MKSPAEAGLVQRWCGCDYLLPVLLLPEPEAPLELGEVVLVLGEVVLLPEPEAPLLLGEVVLVLLPLAPLLAVSPARYSLSESLPSPSVSSDLNLALAAVSPDEEAPVLELGEEEELLVLGEVALLEELPEEPLLIEPLDWLVLGEAELPLVDLSVLLLLCAWTDAAKAAAMAAAIRVLLFIRESPQGKCCSTGKLSPDLGSPYWETNDCPGFAATNVRTGGVVENVMRAYGAALWLRRVRKVTE